MNKEELIKAGEEAFAPNGHPNEAWAKMKKDPVWTPEWSCFYEGWNKSKKIHMDKRRKELKVDEFLQELEELKKKYNATTWYGGGDADCGFAIEEYEFGIEKDEMSFADLK